MYKIVYSNQMKRSLKLMKKRGKDLSKLQTVLEILSSGIELPENILIIVCPETIANTENVILNLIGC